MPVMDGYEATQEIRKLPVGKTLPIVALSALNLETEIAQMEAIRMDGYLEKPLKLGKLYSLFERYLPQSEVEREADESAVEIGKPAEIDWQKAMSHVNGNEALLEEILQSYIDAYHDIGSYILESYVQMDTEGLRRIFLDLSGLNGSIGAMDLYRQAKAIHGDLVFGRFEGMEEKIGQYLEEHEGVIDSLKYYLQDLSMQRH